MSPKIKALTAALDDARRAYAENPSRFSRDARDVALRDAMDEAADALDKARWAEGLDD